MHSEYYQSFGLRKREVVALLEESPEELDGLAKCTLQARSGRAATKSLGLDYHPAVLDVPRSKKNSERDTRYANKHLAL